MKKIILFFIPLLFFLFVPSAAVCAEEITTYETDISIQKNGGFMVGEHILYDFGTAQRHGIYRTIPYIKKNSEGKQFILTVSDFRVTDEQNQSYKFTLTTDGDSKKLKIGDPNTTISGKHLYSISYVVSGGITYFSDHDELYWQITGTQWEIPIQYASAVITLPESPEAINIRMECFTGSSGSSASDCTATYENSKITVIAKRPLSIGEGLTVVVGFPKNIVAVLEPKPVNTWFSQVVKTIFGIVLVVFALFWYLALPIWIVVHWFRTGRDPRPPMGVTKAWFDVPKTDTRRPLTPGETGTLVDERADMREVTATIVDLARRGYLKIIEQKKGDFYLEKRSATVKTDALEQFETTLYDGIFSDKGSIRIKDADLLDTVGQAMKDLYAAVVKERFFVSNPESVRIKYSIIGGLALFTMNFPLALASFIFGRAMPRKTMTGAQNAAIALSLKNFITSQERQYKYQAKNQIFFEKFLPFAIAFGVEKIWAERFKDINLKKPDWYEGYDMRTFNSVIFVHSLNSSLTSFSSSATPTRSSSGFSSGFSGGSVGGGGGGGGGGSW